MPTKVTSQQPQSLHATRTYVLDTSVLLADPGALKRFAEHEVVLPVVVITELEGKRHHPELGYFARAALRGLDELRVSHGRLDTPVPVGELGGSVRVELNHTDPTALPSGFRLGDNDTRILFATAYDGDWDTYINDFATKIPDLMDLLFASVEGWPGIASPKVKDFIAEHQITAAGWFVANPQVTVVDVRRLQRMEHAVNEFLDKVG